MDLTAPQFYEKLVSSKKIPTTAAPSLGECVDLYQRLVREGFRSILVVTVIAEGEITLGQSEERGSASIVGRAVLLWAA